MSVLAKVLRVVVVLALAGGVGVLIGWMKSRDDIKPLAVPPLANQSMAEVAPVAMTTVPTTPVAHTNLHRVQEAKPVVAPPSTEESGDWEKQLDDVLLSDIDANGKAARILALIDQLPAREREAILLSAVDELTTAEIAAALGTTESSIRSRIFRARRELAVLLEKEGIPR